MTIGFSMYPRPDLHWSVTSLPLSGRMIKLLIHPRQTMHDQITYEATLVEILCTPGGDAAGAVTRWEGAGFASRESATDTAMDIWSDWRSLALGADDRA